MKLSDAVAVLDDLVHQYDAAKVLLAGVASAQEEAEKAKRDRDDAERAMAEAQARTDSIIHEIASVARDTKQSADATVAEVLRDCNAKIAKARAEADIQLAAIKEELRAANTELRATKDRKAEIDAVIAVSTDSLNNIVAEYAAVEKGLKAAREAFAASMAE